MSDRLFFSAAAAAAALLIALSLVWPQGHGARAPGPFGSTPYQQRPEVAAAIQREKDAAQARAAIGVEQPAPKEDPAP